MMPRAPTKSPVPRPKAPCPDQKPRAPTKSPVPRLETPGLEGQRSGTGRSVAPPRSDLNPQWYQALRQIKLVETRCCYELEIVTSPNGWAGGVEWVDGFGMSDDFSDAELEAFLDEGLDSSRAAEIEQQARLNPELLKRLAMLNRRRDHGGHSLAAIWRRFQIGVPSREAMGQYLLGIMDSDQADYITFRLETLQCPFTQALLTELRAAEDQAAVQRTRAQRDSLYQSGTEILARQAKKR